MRSFQVKLAAVVLVVFVALVSGEYSTPALGQEESPHECIARNLSEYMNAIVEAKRQRGWGNIQLLSPAFNFTNPNEALIYEYMVNPPSGSFDPAQFDSLWGFAGNTYHVDGNPGMYYFRENGWASALSGRNVIFTEFGYFAKPADTISRAQLLAEMGRDFSDAVGASGGGGVNYFSAIRDGDPCDDLCNSEFIGRHELTPEELNGIVSSNSKAGLNPGLPIQNGELQHKVAASPFGYGWAVDILYGDDVGAAVASINAEPSVQTVLRLCSGDTCDFSNEDDLVDFLERLNGRISRPVYVIVGPNEPATEYWAAPECSVIQGGNPTASGDFTVSPGRHPGTPPEPPIPYTPCNETRSPEFHSLRPYPASPCDTTVYQQTMMCADELTVREVFSVTPDMGVNCRQTSPTTEVCDYTINSSFNFYSSPRFTRLPIVGNTELVPNSQNDGQNQLDYATRMNEYASWYLNGTTSRAEEETESTLDIPFKAPLTEQVKQQRINEVINFSGPIKKLLPFAIQNSEYSGSLLTFGSTQLYEGLRENQQRLARAGNVRHNQIFACTDPVALVPFSQLDDYDPVACYREYDIEEIRRRLHSGNLGQYFSLERVIQWRPFLYGLNPIFSYLPFSSTEDIWGQAGINVELGDQVEFRGSVELQDISSLDYPEPSMMSFPHMIEVDELANILQKTFTPVHRIQQGDVNLSDGTVLWGSPPTDQLDKLRDTEYCEILETRTNPGDLVYGGWEEQASQLTFANERDDPGRINYTANFSCEFVIQVPDTVCIDSCLTRVADGTEVIPDLTIAPVDYCTEDCTPPPPICTQYAEFGMDIDVALPRAANLWDRLVAGQHAIFRRMFPRVEQGAPVSRIRDIPAEDKIWYYSGNTGFSVNGSDADVANGPLAGDPITNTPGSQASIYFPHIGSVQEYFLHKMQCALRPQGNQFCKPASVRGGTGVTSDDTKADCSPEALEPYFGGEAENASCIANAESSCKADAKNVSCLNVGGTKDYSIGIFQINLLSHPWSPGATPQGLQEVLAAAGYAPTTPCYAGFSSTGLADENGIIVEGGECVISDQRLIDICTEYFSNSQNNIEYAASILEDLPSYGWVWWGTRGQCGL